MTSFLSATVRVARSYKLKLQQCVRVSCVERWPSEQCESVEGVCSCVLFGGVGLCVRGWYVCVYVSQACGQLRNTYQKEPLAQPVATT